jgi:NAD(P)H-flavin reductase
VDKVPEGVKWEGEVGVVPTLFDKAKIPLDNTSALVCGPPVMYKFVVQKMLEMKFNPDNILVSLERNMKCGAGICQHCTVGRKYVCKDGPVFTYSETLKMFDRGHDEEGQTHSVCSAI